MPTDFLSTEGWDVPVYRFEAFFPRRSPYCIAVFVLNEGERIRSQLRKMAPYADAVDILVVDGGSTDGALDPDWLQTVGVRAKLVKMGPGKLSAQMRIAFAYALTEGYEGVLTIDGNDKDDPAAIPLFLAHLDQGDDHLQGSRFVPGGRAIHTPRLRLLGIRWLHAPLISWAARWPYTDTTNGFRAYSRRLLLDPAIQPFRAVFATYELHYYLAIQAPRLGYRVRELPVTRRYPAHGPIPTKISPLKGNWLVLRTLAMACLHGYRPRTPVSRREVHP